MRERDFEGAKAYLKSNTVEDLQAIVVHKPSGIIAGNMSSGGLKLVATLLMVKRYLNLTTGEGNMNELDVVINEGSVSVNC